MDVLIKCFSDDDQKINYSILKGTIKIDVYKRLLKKVFTDRNYKDNYHILIDIREAEFPDLLENKDDFSKFLIESAKFLSWKRKCAIITSNPKNVVIAEILKYDLQKQNVRFLVEVFSTYEATSFWL